MSGLLRTALIFAYECAPYHRPESMMGAQRPAQFAKYLPEFGWRAIVICCDRGARGQGLPADLDDRVREALHRADPRRSVIIPIPSLPWASVLDRAWRALLPRGGRGDVVRTVMRKPLTIAKFATGDHSESWQPCARRAAATVASEVHVHACIGEHSPDAGLFLARWFAARYGVPWVADFRDPILRPFSPLGRSLYRPVARRLTSTAAHIVNVTPYWTALDRVELRRPASCIPNGFDPEEFSGANEVRHPRFTIAYTGGIHREMQLPLFLAGLRRLKECLGSAVLDTLRFVYRGRDDGAVLACARAAGVADLVDSEPFVEREHAIALMKGADALLLLSMVEIGDPYLARGLYPGKVFEYFGAGRPILCVPGDGGMLDDLIRMTGTGVVLRDPTAIADYLIRGLGQWRNGGSLPYRPNAPEIARYSRRQLSAQLAAVLDRVTGEAASEALCRASRTADADA